MHHRIFRFIFVVEYCIAMVIRLPALKRAAGEVAHEDRTTRTEWIIMPLSFIGMQLLPLLYAFTSWFNAAEYDISERRKRRAGVTGACTFGAGLVLLWKAHHDLGRSWTSRVKLWKDQQLVTDGVYAYIRHPIYAAHWLWVIGQALMLPNWLVGPAGILTYLPVYLHRVPREEAMLVEHFGDAYRDYMQRTGAVLPRIVHRSAAL